MDNKVAGRAVMKLPSPVGKLTLVASRDGLTNLILPGTPGELANRATRSGTGSTSQKAAERHLDEASKQLGEYFSGKRTRFELPIVLEGTEFQKSVWKGLGKIAYGRTISYGQLADRLGRPNAYRAVGTANGANPIAIILPCHRVLASGGKIGGYGGGISMKRQLLELEGIEV